MTIIILGSMCGIGLVLMVAVGMSLLLLARAGNRDAVGTAREDWVTRRSDSDRREW